MKILILDFWGLGDLILATGALRALLEEGYEVGLLTKPISRKLVEESFPGITYHEINIPWTSHKKKYSFFEWHWSELSTIISELKKEGYDYSASIRADPREDIIPKLAGIKKRFGYRRWKYWPLINNPVQGFEDIHQVVKWQRLVRSITEHEYECSPQLHNPNVCRIDRILLHVGASVKVRRWFLPEWQQLINELKACYKLPVEVIADTDGYGKKLKADKIYSDLSLEEMCSLLGESSLVIGNDSGPTHIASAYGIRTVTIFGPQKTGYFKPWSEHSYVIEGGDCEYKPCKDYCKFSSPKCLEAVRVKEVLEEVHKALN